MLFGLLFTCLDSLIIPGAAACGVGAPAALLAYLFGTVGTGLVACGVLGVGFYRKGSASVAGTSGASAS